MNEPTGESRNDSRTLMEQFRRLGHILKKDFMRSISSEFKPSAATVLMRLWHRKKNGEEGFRMSDLANSLNITVPAVTQIVTALEARGLVERVMDSEDRRAIRVTLTEGGAASLAPFFKRFSAGFDGLVTYLGEEDTADLVRLLSKVERYFAETLGSPLTGTRENDNDRQVAP